jgi:hypothetical protein
VEHQRTRVLSEDEIKKPWKEFDKKELGVDPTFKLPLFTAQRWGEFFSAEMRSMARKHLLWVSRDAAAKVI